MATVGTLDYEINVITRGAKKSVNDFNKELKFTTDKFKQTESAGFRFGQSLRTGISQGFQSASTAAKNFLKALPGRAFDAIVTNLKRVAVAAGALGVAFGTKAIKSAAEFETNLANINTLLRVSQDEINAFGDNIQRLSTEVPVDQSVLSAATYDIVSAGITDTSDALNVLEQSAKLGVAGLGETSEAVNLVTFALNNFNIPADQADQVAAQLFQTVEGGVNTIAELSVGFGRVAPAAVAANVSFEELQAATSALTAIGLDAGQAQTRLAEAFNQVNKQGTPLDKAFQDIGFSSARAAVEQEGFIGALENLGGEAELTEVELSNLFGSATAGNAIFSLLTAQNDEFKAALNGSEDAIESLSRAFEIQNATLGNTFQLFKNVTGVILSDIGQAALGPIRESLLGLNETFTQLIENPGFQRIQEGIGTALGEGVSFIIDRFAGFFDLLSENEDTVLNIIDVIKSIASTISDAFGVILEEVGPSFKELFEALGETFAANEREGSSLASIIASVIGSALSALIDIATRVIQVFNDNRTAILNVAQLVGGLLKTSFEIIGPIISGVLGFIETFIVVIGNGIEGLRQLAGLAIGLLERLGILSDGTKERFLSLSDTIVESARIAGVATDQAFGDTAQRLEDLAVQVSELSPTFSQNLEEAGISADQFAEQINSGALTSQEALDILKQSSDGIREELGSSSEFILEKFNQVTEDYTALNARLVTENEGLLSTAGASLQALAQVASEESDVFSQVVNDAGLSIDTLVEDIGSGAVNFEDAINIIGQALQDSSSDIGEAAVVFDDKFTEITLRAEDAGFEIENFSIGASDSLSSAENSVSDASDGINNSLEGVSDTTQKTADSISDSTSVAGDAIDVLTSTSEAGANQIADSFVGASDTISGEVAQGITDFGNLGGEAVGKLASDTQAGTDQTVQAAQELASGTVDAVSGLPSEFEGIAADLVSGFTNGIRSRVAQAAAAATELASAATNAARANLQIQSPSKVFRELGRFTPEGFLLGISDGIPDVLSAMDSFVQGIISEAEEAEEAPLNFARTFEKLGDVVEDSLDDATDEVRDFVRNNQRAQEQIRDELDETNKSIQDITSSFQEQNEAARLSFQEDAISIILDAEERRAEILEQIEETNKESLETDEEKAKQQERLLELNNQLAEQESILNTAAENQVATEEDLEEARRQAALNPLEALVESFNTEQELRQQQFDEDLARLEEQKTALETSLQEREDEISNFYESLSSQDQAFTSAANAELQKREVATTSSVNRLISLYNRLAAARQAAGLAAGGALPGFKEGGLTSNFSGGGETPGAASKGFKAELHGGEYVMPNPMVKAFPGLVAALESIRPSINSGKTINTNNNQRTFSPNVVVNSPLTLRAVLSQANQFLY